MESREERGEERSALFSLSPEEIGIARETLFEEARSRAQACTRCALCRTRNRVVFGEGDPTSRLMFVGEGPGADEDAQGRPFVGRAGQLLTQILSAAGIDRGRVYITNVVKCRPPENRVPTTEEMMACDLYLRTQIALIRPALLVCLGATPMRWILKTQEGISKVRGRWFPWRGIALMPMYHPSYLLRNPVSKAGSPKHQTWLDIQEVKRQWDRVLAGERPEGIDLG